MVVTSPPSPRPAGHPSLQTRAVNPSAPFEVRPLGGRIGALITGLDTGQPLEPAIVERLKQAVLTYQVVFLRDQSLTYESQSDLAARFGAVRPGHPIFPGEADRPYLRTFDSLTGIRANHWHSDLTFLAHPPAYAFLRSVIAPDFGGDTLWSSGVAALASMPDSLAGFVRSLRVVHSNDADYIDATMPGGKRDYVATLFEAEHAAVQLHPEADFEFILLGGFARRVAGYDPAASRTILGLIQHYFDLPENMIRWSWKPGDLAIWDNLATQHYAVFDYADQHRRNERVMSAGPPLRARAPDGTAAPSVQLLPHLPSAAGHQDTLP